MKIENEQELLEKIKISALTEHLYENVELKRGWTKDYGEKGSMLCNAQPEHVCFLVIGVEDNGNLSKHDDSWLEKNLVLVSQQINQFLDPVIANIGTTTECIDGSTIIIITLKNPGVVVKWNDKAFIGGGTSKRKLESHEILELSLTLPGLTDLTKQKCTYEVQDDCYELFAKTINEPRTSTTLQKYFLNDTNAGRILLGDCKYRIAKYTSNDELFTNETREGLIGLISESIYSEIQDYYSKYGVSGLKISDALLREAFGNCVGHAAFQEKDGEILIELHPEKMVVSNLCYSEYISLANKWFSSAHKSPNPFLMEILRSLSKVDELGRGKKKLLKECLTHGFKPPVVDITDAARHKRWSLTVSFYDESSRYLLLRKRLDEKYNDNSDKALIAYALILWSKKSFSEIAKYFDTHESQIAAEIISDPDSPIFLYEKEDRLILHRWVKILIEEGKASKGFSVHEEEQLYKKCKSLCCEFDGGLITPSEFRQLAHLSNSPSDKSLTTRTLSAWSDQNKLVKIKHGTYRFVEDDTILTSKSELKRIFEAFQNAMTSA